MRVSVRVTGEVRVKSEGDRRSDGEGEGDR